MANTNELKLNTYSPRNKKKFAFTNLQWASNGVVARSAQPNYEHRDGNHTLSPVDVSFLRYQRIATVIGANKFPLDDDGQKRLNNLGIQYHHRGLKDFRAPTVDVIKDVANKIQAARSKGGATLVYCGFGAGRTGTYVAGWAVLHYYMPLGANLEEVCTEAFLKQQFGVETPAQVNAIRAAANLSVTNTSPYNSGAANSSAGGFWGQAASSGNVNFAAGSSGASWMPPHLKGSNRNDFAMDGFGMDDFPMDGF
ncbi:hypothetical protein [Marinibactrum halimedae]|uniref:Tyrosine specific protein phosphatases domain-containing protein n=1 Tax=Marinibactrum halimedae TaxID=1444977 RepID=A0AA37T0T8_9GAMM|nr:hypothetical protein [Marinibactrum halimedae]MCD9459148.1 hypothetical protein [Marinibactrum halimedae]GLS24750.1 hypothetical protein GCM10007877_04640 [Marinibactrum halimedae]